MLLNITTTHQPATDLGFLLHKNPARAQSFDLSFGRAHVFYPEASNDRCTVSLLLDVDPVALVRQGRLLSQYVNDRPYVASSFLNVAIADVFRTAMSGRCKERPELADTPIPLTARLPVVPCREGEEFLRGLFEPLGYSLTVEGRDQSGYYAVTLSAEKRLAELLAHLYVLIPVLDDEKHYWVGDDEVAKLLPKLRGTEGILVAARAREGTEEDLLPGDVIYAINGVSVRSLSELRTVVDRTKRGEALVFQVERKGQLLYLTQEVE